MENTKRFLLQSEDSKFPCYNDVSYHDTWDEAEEEIGKLFDNGDPGDFKIIDLATDYRMRYPGYRFVKENCPVCGKEVRVREMTRTYDCHGIPYRMVCRECCDKIYEERGFDGEQYTEADEELGYDY